MLRNNTATTTAMSTSQVSQLSETWPAKCVWANKELLNMICPFALTVPSPWGRG